MNLFPVPSGNSGLAIQYGQWLRWDGAVSRTVRYSGLRGWNLMLLSPSTKNLRYQQNLSGLPIAVLVLHAHSNELQVLIPLLPRLEEALASLQPRSFVQVGA